MFETYGIRSLCKIFCMTDTTSYENLTRHVIFIRYSDLSDGNCCHDEIIDKGMKRKWKLKSKCITEARKEFRDRFCSIGICGDAVMKKYAMPIIMLVVFETIAITLWLTKDNLFYLFNFSYIGLSVSLGILLFIKKYRHQKNHPKIKRLFPHNENNLILWKDLKAD